MLRRRKLLQNDAADLILCNQDPVGGDPRQCARILHGIGGFLEQARLYAVGVQHQSRLLAFGFREDRIRLSQPAAFLSQRLAHATQLPPSGSTYDMCGSH